VNILKLRAKRVVMEQVLKNLFSTQERAAEIGDVKGVILTSKYLLYLANKFGDEMIDFDAESNQAK
jgi:hypothetical protein